VPDLGSVVPVRGDLHPQGLMSTHPASYSHIKPRIIEIIVIHVP
jgi:hypothetical protein